jgi:hypothetical protein
MELKAKNIVGTYNRREHEACTTSQPNAGRLNQFFKLAGVAYRPRHGTEASVEASKKTKADVYG